MSKLRVFKHITQNIEQNSNTALSLSRGDDLSAQTYSLNINFTHNNASAIPATITDYQIANSLISNLSFEAGAGKKIIDLNMTDLLLRQLYDRGMLTTFIDRTSGNDKNSTIILYIDMLLLRQFSPKDSLFHTWKYNHRMINILGGTFAGVANFTPTSCSVTVSEQFAKGSTPNTIMLNGQTVQDFNVMRKPVVKQESIKGEETDREIKFPSNRNTLRAIVYAVDDKGIIVDGCIENIKIKKADSNIYEETFFKANTDNRTEGWLKIPTTKNLDNVVILDLSQGQLSQGINTNILDEEDTAFYFDIKENGHTNPKIRVIFETVDKA